MARKRLPKFLSVIVEGPPSRFKDAFVRTLSAYLYRRLGWGRVSLMDDLEPMLTGNPLQPSLVAEAYSRLPLSFMPLIVIENGPLFICSRAVIPEQNQLVSLCMNNRGQNGAPLRLLLMPNNADSLLGKHSSSTCKISGVLKAEWLISKYRLAVENMAKRGKHHHLIRYEGCERHTKNVMKTSKLIFGEV